MILPEAWMVLLRHVWALHGSALHGGVGCLDVATAPWMGGKKEVLAPLSANPAVGPAEQGRTSECIPELSNMNVGMHSRMNIMTLGMYSQIERHGDRQTTGDWQIEEILRLGRHISSNCQSPMLCLSRVLLPEDSRLLGACSGMSSDCFEIVETSCQIWGVGLRNSRCLAQGVGRWAEYVSLESPLAGLIV